jgi:hypothetical protein
VLLQSRCGANVRAGGLERNGSRPLPALKRIVTCEAFFGALPDTNHRDAKGAEALLPRMNAGAATERREALAAKREESQRRGRKSPPFPYTKSGKDGAPKIANPRRRLRHPPEKGITSDIELTKIQRVDEAYERMLTGDVKYRFVIDMASLK